MSFATPRTVAHQAPQSMGFSRQEYWSGLPFPPPGDLPNPGLEPTSLASPTLAGGSFTPWGSPFFRRVALFRLKCDPSLSIGTSQAELPASSQVATCAGFVSTKVGETWVSVWFAGVQCGGKKSSIFWHYHPPSRNTAGKRGQLLPSARSQLGPPPTQELGWEAQCPAWAFAPLGRDWMEHFLPMVAMGESEGSPENNIPGWGPRSRPARVSKPRHKLK